AQLTPESNQTSRMSVSLTIEELPHLGQVSPGGARSATSASNHTSAPFSSNKRAAFSKSSGGAITASQCGDRDPPAPLARYAPIGAMLDHPIDPVSSPSGYPRNGVDSLQRIVT